MSKPPERRLDLASLRRARDERAATAAIEGQVALRRRAVWRNAQFELRRAIAVAAAEIVSARTVDNQRVLRTDAVWRVVEVVAHARCCLAIADVARALGVSRQTGHRCVLAAARAGYVELRPNHQDRRLLQLFLTPRGRAEVKAAGARESTWLSALLNGLGYREMTVTTRVLTVIRQRLQRDARELARRKRIPLKSEDYMGDLS